MDALLKLLSKLNPELAKSTLYKVIEYIILLTMLYGVYSNATTQVFEAKTNRDDQLKGVMVQLGHKTDEISTIKDDLAYLREWNKALSARINRLEDLQLRRIH